MLHRQIVTEIIDQSHSENIKGTNYNKAKRNLQYTNRAAPIHTVPKNCSLDYSNQLLSQPEILPLFGSSYNVS